MDALILVPTLVSPNVNPRLIPAIGKLLERNILLNNSAIFRKAVIKKYSSFMSMFRDDYIPIMNYESILNEMYLLEAPGTKQSDSDLQKERDRIRKQKEDAEDRRRSQKAQDLDMKAKELSYKELKDKNKHIGWGKALMPLDMNVKTKEMELLGAKKVFVEPEKIEVPQNIVFFSTVSLEPTYMEIPIENTIRPFSKETSERIIKIGIKVIPYAMRNVSDVVNFMNVSRNKTLVQKMFDKSLRKLLINLPFTHWRGIYKGNADKYDKTRLFSRKEVIDPDILFFSPSRAETFSAGKLKNKLSMVNPTSWSTAVILSAFDFTEREVTDNLRAYSILSKYAWGDIVVVDEFREVVSFCGQKSLTCQAFQIDYLKQILNMANVLDLSVVSRMSKPFSSVSLKDVVVKESAVNRIEKRIMNIIRE